MPTLVEVVLLAVAWSGTAGAVGLLLLRRDPGRSVRSALVGVALLTVATVCAGVVGTARAMFLSPHDLGVVLQVAAVAAVVALVVALVAGRAVVRDVALVRDRAVALDGSADDDGAARPVLRELRDVHDELTATRRRLVAARDRERTLEASRRELVAWVSHDLRTPLAALRGLAEALQDDVAPDRPRYLRQMVSEVDRLSGLVDDLFELSRIQAGTLRVDRQPVDLASLVAGVTDPGAGTGPPAPVVVDADPRTVLRAVRNLVENGRRYGGGVLDVDVAVRGDEAVVAVTDACGGIDPADLDKLFEPGWQGSTSRSAGGSGGLGLAIARGIARAHGGDVVVRSVPGGCRFELTLPR